jgi:hypothetical protein
MIPQPQLIEDLLLLPPAASGLTRLSWLLAADCDLLLLRKSMDQLGGIINGNACTMGMIIDPMPPLASLPASPVPMHADLRIQNPLIQIYFIMGARD